MGYLIFNTDREDEMSGLRREMRRNYRSGNYRNYGGSSASMRGDYSEGYRMGYKHGWEDSEDDAMEMRRARDDRGRYV